MNILVVGTKSLNPIRMGNQRWIAEFINQLQSLGHNVIYLYIHHPLYRNYSKENEAKVIAEAEKQSIADKQIIYKESLADSISVSLFSFLNRKLRKGFGGVDNMYPEGLTRFTKKVIKENKIEACVVNYFYLSKLLTKINVPIKALVTHDSFIYRNKRTGDNTHSLTPNLEAKALQRANHILSLQLEESALFKVLAPESYVSTIFMPIKFHPSPIIGNHNILYLAGSSAYNFTGIKYFIENVFPILKKQYPDTKLIIGGTICNYLKEYELTSGIKLLGLIQNVEDFFSLGDISINPVYQGSGLKIKTIESISYDKVTLVNPHSAEGLLKNKDIPFIEAETLEEWITVFNSLWEDSTLIEKYKERNKKYCEAINIHINKELSKIFLI